ncbi:MAG: hypothetical protein U0V72_14435 [Cytophagales bacterium]
MLVKTIANNIKKGYISEKKILKAKYFHVFFSGSDEGIGEMI